MPQPSHPSPADPRQHAEDLIDEAVDESFPASDPPALDTSATSASALPDALDCLLDEALEETFPASDPIAVTTPAARH